MSQSVVVDITESIAETNGTDPLNIGYSLGEYIDLEAVETLCSMEDTSFTLTFTTPHHEVTIVDGEVVSVSER